MKRITKESVIAMHRLLIEQYGGLDGIRDENLLESECLMPYQTFGGEELFPTPYDNASRFLFGFATNQIFFDGNKRIAVNTMLVCLQLYGIIVQYSDEELIQMGLDVANGIMKEDEVIKSLKRHTIRLI